jgi:hypothetical protein
VTRWKWRNGPAPVFEAAGESIAAIVQRLRGPFFDPDVDRS